MKKLLFLPLICAFFASAVSAETYRAAVTQTRSKTRERPPAPISRHDVDGVIPRAIRGGNPLQMLNPRAPRKYGTSQEAVVYDQNDPAKWRGIKFFEFRF